MTKLTIVRTEEGMKMMPIKKTIAAEVMKRAASS